MKTKAILFITIFTAGVVVPGVPVFASTTLICPELNMVWHDPKTDTVIRSEPYECGADLCDGYRCRVGNEISPACYSTEECVAACGGECVYVPTAQLDCATMCSSAGCDVQMTWYKHKKLLRSDDYECSLDACTGYRCLMGDEISPACYSASECAKSCRKGTCVDIPSLQQGDCDSALCSML